MSKKLEQLDKRIAQLREARAAAAKVERARVRKARRKRRTRGLIVLGGTVIAALRAGDPRAQALVEAALAGASERDREALETAL